MPIERSDELPNILIRFQIFWCSDILIDETLFTLEPSGLAIQFSERISLTKTTVLGKEHVEHPTEVEAIKTFTQRWYV